ncbi:hypothetical protein [Brevundimonas sp. A19_0]|uniref:hypothetical protein n=1 Tax=Brevundimonas sp. A19_0 TaxID=2821087 RepID=UPI001AD996E6|nr:hypothetical protein [Brevundimonas sp. A19_0]MBO9502632.1 hypothetical protein [Brevundimonas sp. A19_0]
MKLQDYAVYLVIVSAAWTVASFAYVFGLFLDRSVALIGFIRIDDVISAAAGSTALIFGTFVPLMAIVSELMKLFVSDSATAMWSSPRTIVMVLALCVFLLMLYLYLVLNQWSGFPYIALVIAATSVLIAISTYYDRRSGGLFGRALAIFVGAVLFSFNSGVAPSGARELHCADVSQNGEWVASGKMFLAVSQGVFLEMEGARSTTFVSSRAFDRIDIASCAKERVHG